MKYFTLILLVLPVLATAQNQISPYSIVRNYEPAIIGPVSPVIMRPGDKGGYEVARPPGLRMRNVGRTLTIIGSTLLVTGIILTSVADKDTYYYYSYNGQQVDESGDPKLVLGVLGIVSGAGMTVPGIIFWSKGAKKYNRYLERQGAAAARIQFRGNGVALSYHF